MIKILLLFLLPLSLFASKILSYNIYDRTDRVDVMITFDTPYEGIIRQNSSPTKILIKLQDAEIESSKVKKISSDFLQSITITPMAGYTQIAAFVPSSVRLIASKTSDAYGLRLRFTTNKKNTTTSQNTIQASSNDLSNLPTKKDTEVSQSYYIVITILIIGIIILFILKRKIDMKSQQTNATPWLFNNTKIKTNEQASSKEIKLNDISIRFQKDIDKDNSVIMLDFDEQSYLVLMGKSNILLDKFTDDKPASKEDFDSILQSRHQELDNFLKGKEEKEPLQVYKEKAASIVYEDER